MHTGSDRAPLLPLLLLHGAQPMCRRNCRITQTLDKGKCEEFESIGAVYHTWIGFEISLMLLTAGPDPKYAQEAIRTVAGVKAWVDCHE